MLLKKDFARLCGRFSHNQTRKRCPKNVSVSTGRLDYISSLLVQRKTDQKRETLVRIELILILQKTRSLAPMVLDGKLLQKTVWFCFRSVWCFDFSVHNRFYKLTVRSFVRRYIVSYILIYKQQFCETFKSAGSGPKLMKSISVHFTKACISNPQSKSHLWS